MFQLHFFFFLSLNSHRDLRDEILNFAFFVVLQRRSLKKLGGEILGDAMIGSAPSVSLSPGGHRCVIKGCGVIFRGHRYAFEQFYLLKQFSTDLTRQISDITIQVGLTRVRITGRFKSLFGRFLRPNGRQVFAIVPK